MRFANDIVNARTYQDPSFPVILHFARQTRVFLKTTKVSPWIIWVGRAECTGPLGEIWGGLRSARCDLMMWFSLWIWHASSCHTARAADSRAMRIPPGRPKMTTRLILWFSKNTSGCRAKCKITVLDGSWYVLALKMSFAKCILAEFFARMHFVFIFLQKCAPRSSGKDIFENQLWAIGLQNFTFWSIEGFKWALIGPSFWHLSLLNFFFRRFSA